MQKQSNKALLILLFLMFTSCVFFRPAPFVATIGLIADVAITERMLETGRYYETNPVLGDNPSATDLFIYTSLIIASMLILSNNFDNVDSFLLGFGLMGWGYTYKNYKLWGVDTFD